MFDYNGPTLFFFSVDPCCEFEEYFLPVRITNNLRPVGRSCRINTLTAPLQKSKNPHSSNECPGYDT